jgi:Protein kinase domain.
MDNNSRNKNEQTTYDNLSLNTLRSSKEERNKDTIGFRIQFIRELLKGKQLKPLLDFDHHETEYFRKDIEESEFDDGNSNDTRNLIKKKYYNFKNVISKIGGRLHYVKSGTTGHTFKGVIDDNNDDEEPFCYAVKVVAYSNNKYGKINNSDRPENAEILMIRLLSYFIINKQTPHIVLPILTFNTSIKPFLTLLRENVVDSSDERYVEFLKKYKKGEYYDEVSILISEWANRGDLLDFIKRFYTEFHLIHWKVFFFQIISTLAVIQSKYPSFRHNDLKANNILVHKVSKSFYRYTYKVIGKFYVVPNIGYLIKLWDFDFSCIPGEVENEKVVADWTNRINIKPKKNRYYDIHYFFNTLAYTGFLPKFLTSPDIPNEVKDFVARIIPPQYRTVECIHKERNSREKVDKNQNNKNRKKKDDECKICHSIVHSRGRLLVDDEYTTPEKILEDKFFEVFSKKNNLNNLNQKKERLKDFDNTTKISSKNIVDELINEDYKNNIKKPNLKRKYM